MFLYPSEWFVVQLAVNSVRCICVSIVNLPYSIRVLLESVVRNCDGFQITSSDVDNILEWSENQHKKAEIPFRPARVILQDFT